jgi:serine/threonine protein kinase
MTEHCNILGNERYILQQMLKDDEPAWQEQVGCNIGPYTLVEQLGEGGFGMVWRAQQTFPVRREVALKLIKLGMDTMQVLGRFDLERQALASMDHPHIAALLDANATPDGRPYFVMELVRGQPINQFCKEKRLPLEQRLRLFQLICQAVQHAHQKGIIHRDLKPNNILVADTEDGTQPKIIDFGIAKAIRQESQPDYTLVTRQDMLIGTPMYMSPEQLDGMSDVDTRADIYALGVVLYELLTDTVPFDIHTQSMNEVLEVLREKPPVRPSTRVINPTWQNSTKPLARHHRLPADLDWITLRALEKERHRRYASAAELGADVEHYLKHEPVLAHPPSLSYTTSRWIERHRAGFIATCICVIAMVCGTLLALWQANVAKAAQRTAEQQRFRSEIEARRALEAESSAKHESQRVQQASTFLTTLLDQIADQVKKGRNPEALRLGLLQSQSALDQLKQDPQLRMELLKKLASLWDNMGERKPAIPMLKEWAELMSQIHGPQSTESQAAQIRYIRIVTDHGVRIEAPPLIRKLQQEEEARGSQGSKFWFELQRELIRALIKLDRQQEALIASDLLMEQAKQHKLRHKRLYHCLLSRAHALETVKRFEEAEALLKECRLLASQEKQPESMHEQIDERMLSIQELSSQHEHGIIVINDILQRTQKTHGPEHSSLIPHLLRLASFESNAQQYKLAEQHAKQALQLAKKYASSAAETDADSHREAAVKAMQTQATICSAQGQHDRAIKKSQAAITLARTQGNSAKVCDAMQHLANIYKKANLLDEAYAQFEQCVKNRLQRDMNYKSRLDEMSEMCEIRIKQQRYDEAMQLALKFWHTTQQEPSAKADADHMAYAASIVLLCWKTIRNLKPDTPEPAELKALHSAIQITQPQL